MDKLAQLIESKYGPIKGPAGWTMQKKPWAPPPAKTYTMKPGGETQDKFNLPGKSNNFGNAFANARKQGLKEFTWNNKKYTTQLKGETPGKDFKYVKGPETKQQQLVQNKPGVQPLQVTGQNKSMPIVTRGIEPLKQTTKFTPGNYVNVPKPGSGPAEQMKSKLFAKKAEYVFEKLFN